ncbi:hypothetical protein R5R35_012268 [Gryllus longicercus]|uniref:Tetraspanin n=1 Tax=Gryllus longicercus TaxID=2509291 RepID=A0AAN9VLJ6_9ORTH
MVSGGMTCVKYLLFVFNLLFVVSGIAVIVVGVMAMYPYKEYSTFMDAKFAAGPLILIVVGAVIFVVAFFGCCGAVRENHCMVVTFSVLLLTIFCVELAAGICGYVYRDDVKTGIEKQFKDSMDKYNSSKEIQDSWNVLQHDLKCCGADGPEDWAKHNMNIPSTCCGSAAEGEKCEIANAYEQGCAPALKEQIEHFALIIGGVAIGIAFVQLVGVIFACCLARSIRKEYETV